MRTDFDLNVFQINTDLVRVHMDAGSMPAVLTQLANVLIEQKYVKPSYTQAALDRERVSPTGLPTKGVGTAIPHASSEHTLKPGIAVGTLAEPVAFGQLGDPDTLLDVSVVFMLSVTEPEAQVYLLQSLIEMYGDEQMLLKLHAATGPDIIVHEVNAALQRIGAARH